MLYRFYPLPIQNRNDYINILLVQKLKKMINY